MAVQVGDPAPGLCLEDADGSPVDLADFRGRPVLLVFSRHFY